jgi:hypothetical protein
MLATRQDDAMGRLFKLRDWTFDVGPLAHTSRRSSEDVCEAFAIHVGALAYDGN